MLVLSSSRYFSTRFLVNDTDRSIVSLGRLGAANALRKAEGILGISEIFQSSRMG